MKRRRQGDLPGTRQECDHLGKVQTSTDLGTTWDQDCILFLGYNGRDATTTWEWLHFGD